MKIEMNGIDYITPEDQFVHSLDIHSLLPQQEPFVMIGHLEHFDMTRVITSTKVSSENIFVEMGQMTPSGLIENIAQTCAARIGYINKYILNKGIQVGFIGAIRNLEIYVLPNVGDVIYTEVNVEEEVFGMTLVQAIVKTAENKCVTAELKIAIKE